MNKTLVKFTNYLDNSANELKRNIQMRVNQVGEDNLDALDKLTIDKYNERVNMSRMLKVPRESWEMYGELFIDFKILSELMIAGGLKGKEVFTVVFYLLEKNIGAHVLDASVRFFDIKKIAKYNFSGYKHLNQKVIVEMVRSEEYGRLVSAPEGTLTQEEKEKLEEFERFTKENPEDATGVVEKHILLHEHYYNKLDSFDYEDIDVVCAILRDFGLNEEFVVTIKNLLGQKLEKRNKKEMFTVVEKDPVKFEDNRISSKEYNLLNRELKKYFDLTNMVVVQPLNMELQIYVVSLMLKMQVSELTIKKALKIMNKELLFEDNSVSMFVCIYNKLRYYESIPSIKEAVDNIMSYLQEMFIVNDEDYTFYKEMIEEELSRISGEIPNTYEYEIEEAKRRI